jgi:hypothetical protein
MANLQRTEYQELHRGLTVAPVSRTQKTRKGHDSAVTNP